MVRFHPQLMGLTGRLYGLSREERGPHTEITGLGIERFTEGK
jgi:hypothetical protein